MESLTAEQTAELDLALRTRARRMEQRTGVDHDDLLQEGHLGALKALRQFDPTRGSMMTFLIAKGQLSMQDYVRSGMVFGRSKQPRPTKLSLDHTDDNGELSSEFGKVEDAPDAVAVQDLLVAAGLDANEWKLTLLRLQGQSYADCAYLLCVSETRIPQLLARIQTKLKLAMSGQRSSRAVEHHLSKHDLRPSVFLHPQRPAHKSLFA